MKCGALYGGGRPVRNGQVAHVQQAFPVQLATILPQRGLRRNEQGYDWSLTTAHTAATRRRPRPGAYLVFFALFAVSLVATHLFMLRLPFYWDEAGQFVPAALDVLRDGSLVPHSATPNAHPPGVMLYLAAVWRVCGYSIEAARAAMLLLASLAMLAAFLLAIELGRGAPGAPAFAAAVFLLASPVFFAQAAMVHLDMPAMLFTSLALLWFLQERLALSALACIVLALTKETGLLVPLVFAVYLARERRWRQAGLFLLPAVPVAVWLAALEQRTGHLFGSTAFTDYNLYYLLQPVRLAGALARRLHYLFVADFHWIGTAAMVFAWRRTGLFHSRPWKLAWALMAAHAAAFTILGGAVLERYLLPVLPVLYAAMAAAMMFLRPRLRNAAVALMALGLAAGNFRAAPYPSPAENSLAWTDAVRVQREAAAFLAARYPGVGVATAWPLSDALARPELGYVDRKSVV